MFLWIFLVHCDGYFIDPFNLEALLLLFGEISFSTVTLSLPLLSLFISETPFGWLMYLLGQSSNCLIFSTHILVLIVFHFYIMN